MTDYNLENNPNLVDNMLVDNNGIITLIRINLGIRVSFLVG